MVIKKHEGMKKKPLTYKYMDEAERHPFFKFKYEILFDIITVFE